MLDIIRNRLDEIGKSAEIDCDPARSLLDHLSDWNRLKNLVGGLISYPAGEVTGYQHDNGFLKLELIRCRKQKVRLRLHLWNYSAVAVKPQAIHNHSFDFLSRVIKGRVEHSLYSVRRGAAPGLYIYGYHRRDRRQAGQYKLRYKGACSATLDSQRVMEKGDYYSMSGKGFHTLNPACETKCATLLVSREHDDLEDADILFSTPEEEQRARNSSPLDLDSIRTELTKFELARG